MAATKGDSIKMAVIARRNDAAIFLISIRVRLVVPNKYFLNYERREMTRKGPM
jgi:hypothetical protein